MRDRISLDIHQAVCMAVCLEQLVHVVIGSSTAQEHDMIVLETCSVHNTGVTSHQLLMQCAQCHPSDSNIQATQAATIYKMHLLHTLDRWSPAYDMQRTLAAQSCLLVLD